MASTAKTNLVRVVPGIHETDHRLTFIICMDTMVLKKNLKIVEDPVGEAIDANIKGATGFIKSVLDRDVVDDGDDAAYLIRLTGLRGYASKLLKYLTKDISIDLILDTIFKEIEVKLEAFIASEPGKDITLETDFIRFRPQSKSEYDHLFKEKLRLFSEAMSGYESFVMHNLPFKFDGQYSDPEVLTRLGATRKMLQDLNRTAVTLTTALAQIYNQVSGFYLSSDIAEQYKKDALVSRLVSEYTSSEWMAEKCDQIYSYIMDVSCFRGYADLWENYVRYAITCVENMAL